MFYINNGNYEKNLFLFACIYDVTCRVDLINPNPPTPPQSYGEKPDYNQIFYTTSDNKTVAVNFMGGEYLGFDAELVSNTYENGLGVLTFSDTITIIGVAAFQNCENLTSVTLPDGITVIGANAFYNTNLTKVTIPNKVTAIGGGAFSECENITSIMLPESLITIGERAFMCCLNLTNITIPEKVAYIGYYAFFMCEKITDINIPNSVTHIGFAPFKYCESLSSITGKFADGRCLIVNDTLLAFASSGISEYMIPENVTELGSFVFDDCKKLESVYCKPTTPPFQMYESVNEARSFSQNAANRKIYVPNESVDAYKSAQGWSKYADDIIGYNF